MCALCVSGVSRCHLVLSIVLKLILVTSGTIGVRANIRLGGQTEFCPNGFSGGGGSSRNFPGSIFSGGGGSSRNFPGSILCGWQNFFSSRQWQTLNSFFFRYGPEFRIIQTCIEFCPNNLHSLPEFMSTNCPNWGGSCPPCPPRPVRLCLEQHVSHYNVETNE